MADFTGVRLEDCAPIPTQPTTSNCCPTSYATRNGERFVCTLYRAHSGDHVFSRWDDRFRSAD